LSELEAGIRGNLGARALGTVYAPCLASTSVWCQSCSVMSLGRWLLVATGVVLVAALPASCSAMANDNAVGSAGPCYGPSCDGGLSLDHYSDIVVGSDATEEEAKPPRDPLCGPATDCNPDYEQPTCSNGPANGGAGGASNGGAGGAAGAGKLGCFVHSVDSTRVAQCDLAGSGVAGDPCLKMTDCAPGYACVGSSRGQSDSGDQTAGQCRHYCCSSGYQCASDTFCAGRALLDPNVPANQQVPVCVAADDCPLSEAYGCDASNGCTCTDGTVCTVVRADDTRSCLPPGTGVTDEPCTCLTGGVCTCAPGYVCSYGTLTCRKLCPTGGDSCGVGICQSSPSLPAGFGICTLAVDAGS
jgi:hypothetical protein